MTLGPVTELLVVFWAGVALPYILIECLHVRGVVPRVHAARAWFSVCELSWLVCHIALVGWWVFSSASFRRALLLLWTRRHRVPAEAVRCAILVTLVLVYVGSFACMVFLVR
jgi:hypothetical protein